LVGKNIFSKNPAKYGLYLTTLKPIPAGGFLKIFVPPGVGMNRDFIDNITPVLTMTVCTKDSTDCVDSASLDALEFSEDTASVL